MAQVEARMVPLEFIMALGTSYSRALSTHPLLVKAITSGVISALGSFVAQKLGSKKDGETTGLNFRSIRAFAIFGFVFSGPLVHFFLNWLQAYGPSSLILKLLIDRCGFGALFIVLALYMLPRLQGSRHRDAVAQLKRLYWSTLMMSFKVWVPVQLINLNYVPIQYRTLVVNLVAFGWNIYLSKKTAAVKALEGKKEDSSKED